MGMEKPNISEEETMEPKPRPNSSPKPDDSPEQELFTVQGDEHFTAEDFNKVFPSEEQNKQKHARKKKAH